MESPQFNPDRPKLDLRKDTLRRLEQDDARSVVGMGGEDLDRLKHMTI